jgi:hypothetical protein
MKKKFNLDSTKQSHEEIMEKLDNPNNTIQQISLKLKNPKAENAAITSEGWNNSMLDEIWQQSKKANSGHTILVLNDCKKAEKWSCRVTMWHPNYYSGWRRIIPKLITWLEKI